ncbi:hypothetical protein FIBSPDRAFT_787996 [Athelia psychrophila]|uniref:Uncharacterized protein n=1 Tax=Athelia psychrophila TaxID=1759441 RepID=A0A166KBG4_9AGAM|nr:hypothetical protein FIBSPDRAFT_787996 [Fibularhizoctonia sp. CBS 109695]
MRCIWSTKANTILRQSLIPVLKPGHATINSRTGAANKLHPPPSSLQTHRSVHRNVFAGAHGRLHQSRSLAQTAVKVASAHSQAGSGTSNPPKSSMTSAQQSRAAAKAMRICVRSGAIADAHYILKSLFQSKFPLPPSITRTSHRKGFTPLQFNSYISPKLAAHALLHELVRVGMTQKAYLVAQNLIKSDFTIHPRTLNLIITRLLAESPTPPNPLSHLRVPSVLSLLFSHKVLSLQPRLYADPSARYAVRLIQHAQHHRQRYSAETLESFVRYFLRRSELLFASLFVGMLVRDYQVKHAMAARLRGDIQACDTQEGEVQLPVESKIILKSRLKEALFYKSQLDKTLIFDVVNAIRESMLKDPEEEHDNLHFEVALQALANIAMLVDERRLPFGDIGTIIRALYSCPTSETKVWILQDGMPIQVEAHRYFHAVVMRLAENPPAVRATVRKLRASDPTPTKIMPPLDIEAYNALIHYALRHRLMPKLATKLLGHMQTLQRPLQPNTVTHNIILRAGTLTSRNGMAEEAMKSLRERRISMLRDSAGAAQPTSVVSEVSSAETPVVADSSEAESMYAADAHTLSSYILHLTSTGRPDAVIRILFDILPELVGVDHPSWGQATDEEIAALKKQRRKSIKTQLRRAASFGPWLFVALLNALAKDNNTGLCERVWLLAKKTELASWRIGDVEPWLLPVHAYTIMMQCYAAQLRKSDRIQAEGRTDLTRLWKPIASKPVRGWAKYIQTQQRSPYDQFFQHDVGRRAGMRLLYAMQDGGREVFRELMSLKGREAPNVQIPRPDARFFNAALALFPTGSRHYRPSQYFKRRMWRARSRYAAGHHFAVKGKKHLMISHVAREMVAHGYSVPIGLRPVLIGHWEHSAFVQRPRRALDTRPYAFPKRLRRTFRAHNLLTMKTRGLPIRRRTATRRKAL